MADTDITTRAAWDKALLKYELAALLEKASRDFGPEYQINEKYTRQEWVMEATHGKRRRARAGTDAAKAFYELAMQRERAIEALTPIFYDPTIEAAQELVLAPAPDIPAVRLKADLINSLDLVCYIGTEHVFDVVHADVERLAA